jgi:hypothetical protein
MTAKTIAVRYFSTATGLAWMGGAQLQRRVQRPPWSRARWVAGLRPVVCLIWHHNPPGLLCLIFS